MGQEKQTQQTQQSTQYTPTPEEKEMQKLQLEQYKQTVGPQTEVQKQYLNLASALGTGGALPGYLNQLTTGISSEAIGNQAAKLASQYGAGFQNLGIGDSGVAFRETARGIGNELLYPTEQFNIGNLQNLLNLALSGQAQVQQPVQAGANTLSQSLAGLRSVNQTSSSTQTSMNPFMKSFQQSAGQSLGSFGWSNVSGNKGWTLGGR